MKKIFTSILILSLLFASTIASNNSLRSRFLQETTPPNTGVDPNATTGTAPADPNTTAPADPNTTAPADPNTTAPADPNTTAPADPNTTAPADPNTTAPADPNTTAPADPNTTAPADPNTTAPADPNTTAPADPNTTAPADPNTNNGNSNTQPIQTTKPQVISVVGRASGKAQIDQVWVRLSVFTEDDEIFNNTKTELKNLGFDESEFSYSGVNIFTSEEGQQNPPQANDTSDNTNPQANNTSGMQMMIKSSMDILTNKTNLTNFYDIATKTGINLIDFVNYQPSEASIQAKREELLQQAIDDAQKMAQKMVERVGFQLGSVLKINVDDVDQKSVKQIDDFKADDREDDDVYLPTDKLSQTVEIKYEMISKSQ